MDRAGGKGKGKRSKGGGKSGKVGKRGKGDKPGKGKSGGKGHSGKGHQGGKGKGKGGKGHKDRPKDAGEEQGAADDSGLAAFTAESAKDIEAAEAASKSTKALVEALRAFSTPKWWLIGQSSEETEGAETDARQGSISSAMAASPSRKRAKPEEFQKMCVERHAEMLRVYESILKQDSEQRWLRKVSAEGTAGDRVASLTMLIQVCPVFATSHIRTLLSMAGRTARSDSMMAMDALKDIFISTLLPDRKLKTLSQMQPVSPKGMKKSQFTELCVASFFEDYLKTAFAAFVQILGEAAHNAVTFFKTKTISIAYDLLAAKPEQERALLGLLVNKFGDTAPKVSSNVAFSLKKLMESHPGMKMVVAKEVQTFLARPNVTQKSQYFTVLLLSEIILSRKDGPVAAQLVNVFVGRLEAALARPVFGKGNRPRPKWQRKTTINNKTAGQDLGDDNNRFVRTLINGIQRCMPYLDTVGGSPLQTDTVNALYKVCHTVSAFSTRISILSLLFRTLSSDGIPNRFFRLLYEQLVHFELFSSAHRQQAYLLFNQSLPSDVSVSRSLAICRRFLQVGANAEPAVAVAALAVLRQLFSAHPPELKPLLSTVESSLVPPAEGDDEDDEEHFVDDALPGVVPSRPAKGQSITKGAAKSDHEQQYRYEPLAREPRFARARHTPMWELFALSNHVHPFVAHGAVKLLESKPFSDVGSNPFEIFSCSELLEQFTYASRGHRDRHASGKKEQATPSILVPFNSERFSQRKNVQPHERFFQQYFRDVTVQQTQKKKADRKKQTEEDYDEEEAKDGIAEEEEDKFFDDFLQGQMPQDEEEDDEEDPDEDFAEDSEEEHEGQDAEDSGPDDAASQSSAEHSSKKTKRTADQAELPMRDRIKALKKQHAGSMFASVEDFEQLLDDDDNYVGL